jgi:hypothetical protein
VTQANVRMGGSFPVNKGRTHTYPAPSDEAAWTKLVNNALRLRHDEICARREGREKPVCAQKSKYEYLLNHCSKKAKQQRAIRNKHRKLHGLVKGDNRVVHHNNQRTMSFASTEVLTPCQHKHVHGKECIDPSR